ncbi:MAG: DeoR/GlpR family DNA-binding transcription regulator [Desulfopila sp.]
MKPQIIPAQRRKLILDLIRQKDALSVHELAGEIGASLPTIRRDLDWLAKAGSIERSHGGAVIKEFTSTTYEPDHQISATMARQEKASIGALAADQLKDHQSVIFDSSTTVYEAAQLAVKKQLLLTAVTNDLRISQLFNDSPSTRLIVCGGTLRPFSYSLTGEPGTSFLEQLKVDIAVMGIHAVNNGICYDTSLEISYIKRYMVQAAERVLLLADASKFNEVAFFEAFKLDERMEVITDSPPPPSIERSIETRGAKITYPNIDKSGDTHEQLETADKEKLN